MGFVGVEDFKYLLLVSLAVFDHFLPRQGLAGDIFAGGVADHAGEIANQENGLVAQVLKLFQFVQQDGMA